jgi:hypothetical protein
LGEMMPFSRFAAFLFHWSPYIHLSIYG